MRFIRAIELSKCILVLTLLLSFVSFAAGQENGEDDLDKAFDLKIKAKSIRDLESVVKLCKSAIKKGLEDEDVDQAKQLASTTLFEHADQLIKEIRRTGGNATRFQYYRREAVNRLEDATELDPEMASAYRMMANLKLMNPGADREAALENIEKAIELSSGEPEELSSSLLTRAKIAAATDPDAALADVNQAVKINEGNKEARILRAEYYFRKGEIGKALEDLDVILEGSDYNAYFRQAGNLRSQAFALKATKRVRDDEKREQMLADIREAAVRYAEKAIELKPKSVEAYDLKARLQFESEDWSEVTETVEEILEIDSKNIDAVILGSRSLALQEKMDEALEQADRAIKLDPESSDAVSFRGQLHLSQNDMAKAIKDAKRAAEIEPASDALQRDLAQYYVIDDQPGKAIDIYDDLLADIYKKNSWEGSNPREGFLFAMARMETLRSRGDSFLAQGEHEKAVEDYQEAVDLVDVIQEISESMAGLPEFEGDHGVLNNFAWVLSTSPDDDVRDGDRAIELATKACEITDYKRPHILSTLASAYAETGDFDEAIKWIEKALEVNDDRFEDESVTEEEIDSQRESLEKELASYEKEEPWREKEDAAADRKKRLEEAGEEDESDEEQDEEDSDDEDDEDGDKDEGEDGDEDEDSDEDEKDGKDDDDEDEDEDEEDDDEDK